MKLKLTAKSYVYKDKEYHNGDVIDVKSIEQIPFIFRQFFKIVEDNKINDAADKVTNTNTDTTEIKEEAKSDTTAKKVTNKVNKAKK